MTINLDKLKNYKQEITFLIDKQAKIYYHNIDLFHDHEDLILENKIKEFDVCRLVYDPNSNDASFCGIPGISASCNVLFNNLPFELKSTHLNAIENWIKDYDKIIEYAEEHKEEYDPDGTANFIRSMNRIFLAQHMNVLGNFENCCKEWKRWCKDYPVLKYLDDKEEINKLSRSGIIGQFFKTADREEYNDYLQDCIERAEQKYKRISIKKCSSFIEEKAVPTEESIDSQTGNKRISYSIKQKMDLARFIEVSNQIINDSGEPGALYFTIGGQLLYSVMQKIATRACELNDPILLELLERLKLVEPEGEENDGNND